MSASTTKKITAAIANTKLYRARVLWPRSVAGVAPSTGKKLSQRRCGVTPEARNATTRDGGHHEDDQAGNERAGPGPGPGRHRHRVPRMSSARPQGNGRATKDVSPSEDARLQPRGRRTRASYPTTGGAGAVRAARRCRMARSARAPRPWGDNARVAERSSDPVRDAPHAMTPARVLGTGVAIAGALGLAPSGARARDRRAARAGRGGPAPRLVVRPPGLAARDRRAARLARGRRPGEPRAPGPPGRAPPLGVLGARRARRRVRARLGRRDATTRRCSRCTWSSTCC